MHFKPVQTNRFRRDVKKMSKSGRDINLLENIVRMLVKGEPLPARNRDHLLVGEWQGYRECHITPDWLLIYCIQGQELILTRTGSHAELF